MTGLKGFDSMYEDSIPKDSGTPLPGTYAHLRWTADEKKKRDEAEKAVDKSLLISEDTTTPTGPDPLTEPDPQEVPGTLEVSGPLSGPGPQKGGDILKVVSPKQHPKSSLKIPDGDVRITRNYMFLDVDVLEAIKDMTEAESRIYLFLVLRSYGQRYPKNICYTTNSEMSPHIGISHKSAFARAQASLETRGFIERLYIARKRGEKTKFRVFLPCEIEGFESRTIIESISPELGHK